MHPPASRISTLILAVFLGGLTGWTWSSPAYASSETRWSAGGWKGASSTDKAGNLHFCVMEAKYKSGISLLFLQFPSYKLSVGMAAKGWSLDPSGKYRMTLAVDGRLIGSASGVVLPYYRHALWLNLGNNRRVRELLRRGRTMRLLLSGRKYGFNLTGTAVALERLELCVTRALRRSLRQRPPQPQPTPRAPTPEQPAPELPARKVERL